MQWSRSEMSRSEDGDGVGGIEDQEREAFERIDRILPVVEDAAMDSVLTVSCDSGTIAAFPGGAPCFLLNANFGFGAEATRSPVKVCSEDFTNCSYCR